MTNAKIQSCPHYNVAIAGAGVAGLTLACLLAEAGLSVVLIDPAEKPVAAKPSGRTVALMNASLNILKAAGLQTPENLGNPLRIMKIIDDSAARRDPLESSFAASDMGLPQYGFNIPGDPLVKALHDRAQTLPSLTIRNGQSFERQTLSAGHIEITLKSDENFAAQILVGADGRKSAVRESCGIGVKHHDYGQSAITCLIGHSRPHLDTATEFHRSSGPLAFVPMKGNFSSVVWVEHTEKAEALLKLRQEEFRTALEKASAGILGTITLETPPEMWPLCSIQAERLSAPRVALIAEAAHVLSPITAQGLNLSLRDVAALAETVVDAARAGIDIGSAAILKIYEGRRKVDTASRVAGVDTMMRLVSVENGFLKNLRRTGLQVVATLPPLKSFAMEQGLAPTIDQGRLAQGKAL